MLVKRPKRYRPGKLRLHILPIIVWAVTIAGIIMLFRYRVQRFEVIGLAQGRIHLVAASCSGRLTDVPVQLFQQVRQGDRLAVLDMVLDNENIKAELDIVQAEIRHLQAQLKPTREQLEADAKNAETDIVATQRRFAIDVENANLRTLELIAIIETDKIVLRELALDVEGAKTLGDAEAPIVLQKAQAEFDTCAKRIMENQNLLDKAQQNLQKAKKRKDEFAVRQPQHPEVDSALEVINKAVEVQRQMIQQLLARRNLLVLESPCDGIISLIERGPGETVQPGEPILTVAETEPSEIVTYAAELQLGSVRNLTKVKLVKFSEPKQIMDSQVVHLGPQIEMMPQRLWRDSNIPQWGRPILIEIPPSMKLIPGEMVGIKGL